jgi:hypothetical protein
MESKEKLRKQWDEMHGRQWIAVGERLPDDRVRVLACYDGRVVTAELFEGLWHWIEGKTFTTHVTHWMPLPEPPAT